MGYGIITCAFAKSRREEAVQLWQSWVDRFREAYGENWAPKLVVRDQAIADEVGVYIEYQRKQPLLDALCDMQERVARDIEDRLGDLQFGDTIPPKFYEVPA